MRTTRNNQTKVMLSAIALLACACSSSSSGSGTAGSTAGPGLSGVWVGSGSRAGGPAQQVTITLQPDVFSVMAPSGSLVAQRQPGGGFDITWLVGKETHVAVAQQGSPGSSSVGVIPFDLTGAWTIGNVANDASHGCSTSLSGASATAICTNVMSEPRALPYVGQGSATAVRTESLASSFGDLGGTWQITLSGGGSCTATFQGSTFSSVCTNADTVTGTMNVTIDGNLASGMTSAGYEFSAQRQ